MSLCVIRYLLLLMVIYVFEIMLLHGSWFFLENSAHDVSGVQLQLQLQLRVRVLLSKASDPTSPPPSIPIAVDIRKARRQMTSLIYSVALLFHRPSVCGRHRLPRRDSRMVVRMSFQRISIACGVGLSPVRTLPPSLPEQGYYECDEESDADHDAHYDACYRASG